MLGFLRRSLCRRPVYRTVTAPFVNKRFAHEGKEIFTEGPNGFLFNEKPLKPGEKRKWEDWEDIFYIGVFTNLIAGILVYIFKPSDGLESWAREEALKRLAEKKAIKEGPELVDGDS